MNPIRPMSLLLAGLLAGGFALAAAPAHENAGRPLPPRLEQVLAELSIDDAQRAAVRELLQARRAQHERDRDADRAALRRLVSNDQAVAIEAALPPPGGRRRPPPGDAPAR